MAKSWWAGRPRTSPRFRRSIDSFTRSHPVAFRPPTANVLPVDQLRRVWALLLIACLTFVGSIGCGAKTAAPQTPVTVEPVPPPPKDAAELARQMAGAKIGTMIRVERLRGHPAGERLVRFGQVGDVFEGTDVDLLRDASLAFIASTGITRDDTAVVVVQHSLAEERLRSAIEVIMKRSDPPGQWLEGTKVPAARVNVRGHERIIALPSSDFLVVLPMALASQVDAFEGPLKLTTWDGPEAVVAVVDQPSESLRAQHAPAVPKTISQAEVRLVLQPEGGLDIAADALSTTPEQAAADADALTQSVDRSTTMKVAFVRVRFFRKVPFRAEGDHVKADVKMSAQEVAQLLSMAEMLATRRN